MPLSSSPFLFFSRRKNQIKLINSYSSFITMGIFNPLCVFFLIILCHHHLSVVIGAENGGIANSTNVAPPPPQAAAATVVESRMAPLKPGIAAIVGIITTIFAMTFLLLLYVKHCKRSAYAASSSGGGGHHLPRRNSGINRKVIESLPLFRFSSLRGQKDGLECAVCLNRFEAEEVLRLLPKCKHAFHVECVDTWLDAHSTCPLCRYRVHPEDVLLVDGGGGALYNHGGDHSTPRGSDSRKGKEKERSNPRISGRHSSAGERSGSLEVIVENPDPSPNPNPNRREDFRGRISLDSWKSTRRKTGEPVSRSKSLDSWRTKASRKDGQLPVLQADKHRVEHRIIISGGGGGAEGEGEEEGRRRWSDVEAAAEWLYLGSEMLIDGGVRESGSGVMKGRSVSELTGVSRYRSNNGGGGGGGGGKEERERLVEEGVVKRWLAWISQSQPPAVHSAAIPPRSSHSSSNVV